MIAEYANLAATAASVCLVVYLSYAVRQLRTPINTHTQELLSLAEPTIDGGWKTVFAGAAYMEGDTYALNRLNVCMGRVQDSLNTAGIAHKRSVVISAKVDAERFIALAQLLPAGACLPDSGGGRVMILYLQVPEESFVLAKSIADNVKLTNEVVRQAAIRRESGRNLLDSE